MSILSDKVTFGGEHELFVIQIVNEPIWGNTRAALSLNIVNATDNISQDFADFIADQDGPEMIPQLEVPPPANANLAKDDYSSWRIEKDISLSLGTGNQNDTAARDNLLAVDGPAPRDNEQLWTYPSAARTPPAHPSVNNRHGIATAAPTEEADVMTWTSGGGMSRNAYRLEGREFVSPIFRLQDHAQYRQACEVILEYYEGQWTLLPNDKCSFHVHVGLPIKDPLYSAHCLPVFRRVAIIAVICEHAMSQLVERDEGDNPYCRRYNAPGQFDDTWTVASFMNYILACQTATQLQKAMLNYTWEPSDGLRQHLPAWNEEYDDPDNDGTPYDRYFRVSFTPLTNPYLQENSPYAHVPEQYKSGNKGTVEFRVHGGTVEPNVILAWTLLCGNLVRTCTLISDMELRNMLNNHGGFDMDWQSFLDCFIPDPYVRAHYSIAANRAQVPSPGSES
jgi:hypothetical protein